MAFKMGPTLIINMFSLCYNGISYKRGGKMSKFDEQYIDLCKRILAKGEKITNYKKSDKRSKKVASAIPDHTAQGSSAASTIRLPHQVLQFDLSEEFPILTSKKVAFKTAVIEILWIY